MAGNGESFDLADVSVQLSKLRKDVERLRSVLVQLADNTEAYLDLEKDGQRNYPDSLRLCIDEAREATA